MSENIAAEPLFSKWFDTRIIAAIRWLIASTGLVLIYLDPKQPDRAVALSYTLLALYTLYSAVLYLLSIKRNQRAQSLEWLQYWVDVAWYSVLIALCTGTNRIFFFGFIFVTLAASFRRGFGAGMSIVAISTISYTLIGYSTETADPGFSGYGFDVYRFLLRPVYLMVLGYMMAYWGGLEITLKRRLAMLKDVTLSNPRFGVDRTIYSTLERLREFYNAEEGLLIANDPRGGDDLLYRVGRERPELIARAEKIEAELAKRLRSLPSAFAVSYVGKRRRLWPLSAQHYYAYDVTKKQRSAELKEVADALAVTLDAASFITVPVFRQNEITGRLYFTWNKARSYDLSEIEFLRQALEHVSPIVENIRLVDRLASDAAEQERQRIARDIHDSVIQPYIGFQIGLSGMRRKALAGQVDMQPDIERLLEMTNIGIDDLRSYVKGLKHQSRAENGFCSIVQRFTSKFAEATGINVQVIALQEIYINDGLAAEAFQIIPEALSNIRRHTEATTAVVRIDCDNQTLRLSIENEISPDAPHVSFTPLSISERVASLGGKTIVGRGVGGTVVRIEIPL